MPNEYQLMKDGALCQDEWIYADEEVGLSDAPSIISLSRLKAEADVLRARNAKLGVQLLADGNGKTKLGEDVQELEPYLDMLSLVSIAFPTYRNGRGFSAARVLREQFNFDGELRASGEVLHDQWAMMRRCGITAFELAPSVSLETFSDAMGELTDAYQPAADDQRGALWQRHK
ncbi:MAG: DUF934 domain-containing protein [Rhodobiaceae bacterium]|jgi:uncharacterized protein (DUF934 family)|nr:DUF934 domain-containing protein [Rhodobiaceae bacterium]